MSENGAADATAAESSTDTAKREAGKSRRAPWRTQKHAAARKSDEKKSEGSTPEETKADVANAGKPEPDNSAAADE